MAQYSTDEYINESEEVEVELINTPVNNNGDKINVLVLIDYYQENGMPAEINIKIINISGTNTALDEIKDYLYDFFSDANFSMISLLDKGSITINPLEVES